MMNEQMVPISVVILAKNAERRLPAVLDALRMFDEVVVLDNGSTDQTAQIAHSFANVSYYRHDDFDGFGNMKNRAVGLARHDWILSIDADEIVSPQLQAAIAQIDWTQPTRIYAVSRLNHYRGQPFTACGWSPDIIPRVFHRQQTKFSSRAVHEAVMVPEGVRVETLAGSLHHYSFDDAAGLLQKMQQYSSLFAEQFAHKRRTSASAAWWHGVGAFVKAYFFKRGWQQGADGLTIALSQAGGAYYKYAKLLERNRSLSVSLIITTYNRPDALQKVLYSVLAQSTLPAQILVADDGSGDETAQVVADFATQSPIPVQHIWQPDDGFRLAQSRNRALAAASDGNYIVMIDGDMVLHRHFIADHIDAAQQGCFIQGSRVLLTAEKTQQWLQQPRSSETLSWWQNGIKKRLSAMRCVHLSHHIWRNGNQHFRSIKGCNMGFFRADALAVNGFNNAFEGWGREDSEFVARLYHAGCLRRNLKFAGIAYHLWHNEAQRDALPQNDALLQQTLAQKLTRCEHGVDEFLTLEQLNHDEQVQAAFDASHPLLKGKS